MTAGENKSGSANTPAYRAIRTSRLAIIAPLVPPRRVKARLCLILDFLPIAANFYARVLQAVNSGFLTRNLLSRVDKCGAALRLSATDRKSILVDHGIAILLVTTMVRSDVSMALIRRWRDAPASPSLDRRRQ